MSASLRDLHELDVVADPRPFDSDALRILRVVGALVIGAEGGEDGVSLGGGSGSKLGLAGQPVGFVSTSPAAFEQRFPCLGVGVDPAIRFLRL